MTAPIEDIVALRDLAASIGLPIADGSVEGVLLNRHILSEHALRVLSFPLPRDIEAAPIFQP